MADDITAGACPGCGDLLVGFSFTEYILHLDEDDDEAGIALKAIGEHAPTPDENAGEQAR